MFLFKGLIPLLFFVSCTMIQKPFSGGSSSYSDGGGNKFINRGTTLTNLAYRDGSGKSVRIIGHQKFEMKESCVGFIEDHYSVENLKTGKEKRYLNTYQFYFPFLDPNKMKIHTINVAKRSKVKVISGNQYQYVLKIDYDSKENALIPFTTMTIENDRADSVKVKLKNSLEIKFSSILNARNAQGYIWKMISTCSGK